MTLRNIAASMRHVRARRFAVGAANVLACSGLVGFIACADGGLTEPAATSAPTRPSMAVLPADWWAPRAAVTVGDTTINVFTIDPRQGGSPVFGRGGRIVIPAGAICDPVTSGYGPPTWAKPCSAASANITFTVRSWTGKDGASNAVFSPDVRFAPSQTVLLYLGTSTTATAGAPIIRWCTSLITQCVDEGATDPTLATTFDPYSRSAWRRIKHFSGYNGTWGRSAAGPGQ